MCASDCGVSKIVTESTKVKVHAHAIQQYRCAGRCAGESEIHVKWTTITTAQAGQGGRKVGTQCELLQVANCVARQPFLSLPSCVRHWLMYM